MASRKGPPMREQVTKPLDRRAFIDYVSINYRKSRDVANRLFDISLENPVKNEPCDGGYFSCSPVGGPGNARFVTITDHSSGKSSGNLTRRVAPAAVEQYTDNSASISASQNPQPRRKGTVMARGRTAVAEPETPETDETVKDYTVYAGKEPTPTMVDFADWLIQEVGLEFGTVKEQNAFRDGVRLGGTLRMEFQRSEFNVERREKRRQAREAAAAAEPEANGAAAPAPAKPAARGKAATAKSAATTTTKPTAPARRGRGAVAAAAKPDTAAAPY